jgi:hypothetical protein
MSLRGYILDEIFIDFSDFADIALMGGEISFTRCSLSPMQRNNERAITVLSVLRLVECNPHIKRLVLENNEIAIESRMIAYLSKHCKEVNEIHVETTSAEAIRLVMASFPNLSTIWWNVSYDIVPNDKDIALHPNIEVFKLDIENNVFGIGEISALIQACPNLKTLECAGYWCFEGLTYQVMDSCRKLQKISLHYQDADYYDSAEIFSTIANYGSQVKELSMEFGNLEIDISDDSIREDLITLIPRLHYLNFDSILTRETDPDQSISSIFCSPVIKLRFLDINTANDDADQIAMMLQGCADANTLFLRGKANISEVMMKISDSCHNLVDVDLNYPKGTINGEAMRRLLQSNRKIKEFVLLRASIEVKAYEALALYGESITYLRIDCDHLLSDSQSFAVDSPLYGSDYKSPQRSRLISYLECAGCCLDVKSLAKFYSCFGVIAQLTLVLNSCLLPEGFGVHQHDEIPIYHARQVTISSRSRCNRSDAAFLAMMSACRSMKRLTIEPEILMGWYDNPVDRFWLNGSSLITLAYNCSHRYEPLSALTCPRDHNLKSVLNQLLPNLKLTMSE